MVITVSKIWGGGGCVVSLFSFCVFFVYYGNGAECWVRLVNLTTCLIY